MASRQVMRSVSADFCASAGAAIAISVQAASSAPPSQVSDRIVWSFLVPKRRRHRQHASVTYKAGARRREHKQPACQRLKLRAAVARLPKRWRLHLSVDGLEQPFEETVDGLAIDPTNHGHEFVLRIDIDHIGAVADVGK